MWEPVQCIINNSASTCIYWTTGTLGTHTCTSRPYPTVYYAYSSKLLDV